MKKLHTEILINADRQTVWNILTDLEKYGEWNPFIREIKGKAEEGQILENHMYLEEGKKQVFKPEVLKVEEGKEFRWLGKLFVKGLFDGEHFFLLEEAGEGQVKLIQGEIFSGLLMKPIMKMIGEQTLNNFHAMNKALKARCENL
jgi:hypothetical protein